MFSSGHDFRRRLLAVLTCWMTVVGLGVSVSHCHAAGEETHTHGMGLNVPWACCLPVTSGDGPLETHTHLIILGIELPGEHVPGPGLPSGCFHLEAAAGTAAVESDADVLMALSVDVCPVSVFAAFSVVRRHQVILASRRVSVELCHPALRLRTGVLIS